MKRVAPSSSADASDTDNNTDVVRSALLQEHDRLRQVIARKHKEEIARFETKHRDEILAFETQCQQDLNAPEDCMFVKRLRSSTEIDAKKETTLEESKKEENTGKDNSKNYDTDDDDDGDDDEKKKCSVCNRTVEVKEDIAELETCFYCAMNENNYPSIKCASCSWTTNGGMTCHKDNHGFCHSCVADVQGEDPAQLDIPKRMNPQHPHLSDGPVERDHLHPFHICDCGICAWCGEYDDECCADHYPNQLCSCFPEVQ